MLTKPVSKSPNDIILFGSLGDLACRKLLPALYQLEAAGHLHSESRIIGCGREELNLSSYHEHLREKAGPFLSGAIDETVWQRFMDKITYCQLDLTNPNDYLRLKDHVKPKERTVISYFAIPPSLYTQACQGLFQAGLTEHPARVVLEKPIGQCLESSQAINDKVANYFAEDQIYRIDHYLGKETVLNLLVLRFANSIFSLNWDHRIIDKVEITVAEEIGVEGRWDYYNQAGQVRDMLQNHLLQILSLIAMEPPLSLSAEDIRSEKLKVLKSLRTINAHNVHQHTVRAQYSGNELRGTYVSGYLEDGTQQESQTETFVAVKAYIDNWRWSGVPFYLLTGKRLPKKQSEVVIYFRPQPYNLFQQTQEKLTPNQLIIRLQPDEGVEVKIMNKIPGLDEQITLHESKLDLNFNHAFNTKRIADAYERLLLEIMLGNQYLFVSRNEIEQAWTWIDGIKTAWESQNTPLHTYPAGTWGPKEVFQLFNGQSHFWDTSHATS